MTSNTDDVAAAFRSANPVPPEAFEDAVQDPQASRTLRQILSTRPERATRRFWRRPAILAAPLATIAAAAVVVLVTGAGPQTSRVVTTAYTLTSDPGGTVSLVFNLNRDLTDPGGLSRALASQGVPNRVLISSPSCPPGSSGSHKPPPAGGNVISAGPNSYTFTLHPRLMPAGSVVVVTILRIPPWALPGPAKSSAHVAVVSLTDHPPTCVTWDWPAFGRSAG